MSTSHTNIRRSSRVFIARRFRQVIRYHSVLSGIGLACARFFSFIGVLALTLWSYSVWGSTASPLRALLVPAIIFLFLGIVIRLMTGSLVKQTHRIIAIDAKRKKRLKERET